MAFLKLKMTLIILMSVLFLMPVCTGNDCITVNQDRVDFKTAEEACHERNGHLMTLQPDTDESILNSVSQELFGNVWIGLRLPAGACSNLSAPLRGYEWTSGSTQRNFIPSISSANCTVENRDAQ
uniref:C-type lectin domain-containing protein n=1 Tax=Lates calcarifer TaxID=8187 RepID=A0A4W6DHW6_LATCA